MKALDVQVGGDHYKRMAIQPAEYNIKNGLSFAAGNVVKYVTRYQFKNGMEDLLKAKHYLEMLIEHENDRTGNVNQPQPTGSDSPQAGGAGDYTDQGGSEPASESDPGDGRQGDDSGELKEGEKVAVKLGLKYANNDYRNNVGRHGVVIKADNGFATVSMSYSAGYVENITLPSWAFSRVI